MKTIAILSAITTFATIATAQPVIDGTSYTEYGDVCVLQNNNTNFGDKRWPQNLGQWVKVG